MKDVVINIHSIHAYDVTGEEDSLDFTTDGMYSYENGVCRLSYMESEVTGMPGTHTIVEVSPQGIVVDRKGSLTSRMEFREGMRNSFLYNTPYGTATMGVDTRRISHSFNEHGGSAEIDYVVDMEHTVAVRNKFKINVREQTGVQTNG